MLCMYSQSFKEWNIHYSHSHKIHWYDIRKVPMVPMVEKDLTKLADRSEQKKRASLGGLHRRKMLAFCCQKQFSSTLDNMRQYSNTAQWRAEDVTKPQVSKKNQQQTNLRVFWTRALTDNPLAASATPRNPQIESFATHLLGSFGASWHIDRVSLWWQCPGYVIDLFDVQMERKRSFTVGWVE